MTGAIAAMSGTRRKRYRIDVPREADGSYARLPIPADSRKRHRLVWIDPDGKVGQSIAVFDRERCLGLARELNAQAGAGPDSRLHVVVFVPRP